MIEYLKRNQELSEKKEENEKNCEKKNNTTKYFSSLLIFIPNPILNATTVFLMNIKQTYWIT